MRPSRSRLRRLILGMSIEDARSKFDSPESRVALRLAHERHNQGLYHELILAQRQRNRLPGERRCHLVRHTKPTVKGFQAYIKSCPEDYVVREIWRVDEEALGANALTSSLEEDSPNELPAGSSSLKDVVEKPVGQLETTGMPQDTASMKTIAKTKAVSTSSPSHLGVEVASEAATYVKHREIVLSELSRVAEALGNNARQALAERRSGGALLALGQSSVVDRLVDSAKEAKDKGYTSLSSSSHLLEPLPLTMIVCSKKDKHVLEAFRSPVLCFPAAEGHVSLSLGIAGRLIESNELSAEFPYHVAKHTEPRLGEDGVPLPPSRMPKALVEVYFSPELYQLQQTIGLDGVLALRRFIGSAMRRQHDPLAVSPSVLLGMTPSEQAASGFGTGNSVRIPWQQLVRAKVAVTTGTILQATEEGPQVSAMRAAVRLVWRAWGHLVKDLHVRGDLDYLHVAVIPKMEESPTVRTTDDGKIETGSEQAPAIVRSIGDAVDGLLRNDMTTWKGYNPRKAQTRAFFVPSDFVVVECLLEKKGLPHRLVVEDIVETLTELQRQGMEMQRLAIANALVDVNGENSDDENSNAALRPVLYAPKVSVSHAGVIDAAAHSFQRIRIRGSCVAHVEALARALSTGNHFTEREDMPELTSTALPPNLSFSLTHSDVHSNRGSGLGGSAKSNRWLVGHRVSSSYAPRRMANGRLGAQQTLRPLGHMVVDQEEQEFWREHYYRLSDVQLIFHDRVTTVDASDTSKWSSRLKEQFLILSQRNCMQQQQQQQQHEQQHSDGEVRATGNGTTKKRNNMKKQTKRGAQAAAAAGAETAAVSLEEFARTMNPEKLFEYLCVDMEVESASYDFRVGDNDGYAYRVKLRRIPQSHLPLVKPAMRSLEEKGFINYFGPQRFSSYTKYNMHPGLHLLKGEFRAAASIIVQQFHLDASLAAERRRSGSATMMPMMYHSKGIGFRLPDFSRRTGGRTIAEHGTTMQAILDNALQAAAMLDGEATEEGIDTNGAVSAVTMADDPCAEAFLRVIGPNVCAMLVHEFLAFVWNDIVNQRLQRYGTFAVLPGDLVRTNPLASPHSSEFGRVVYASKKDIERGKYSCWDVVLPVPGAGVQLPENHTTDLYIVTLKRLGVQFNPESRQWDVFYPRRSETQEGRHIAGAASSSSSSSSTSTTTTTAAAASPYRRFASFSALVEEELGSTTPLVDAIEVESPSDSAALLRMDLRTRPAPGNPLGITIRGFHRHALINPSPTLKWRVQVNEVSDPHQRWAFGMQRAFVNRKDGDKNTDVALIQGGNNHHLSTDPQLLLGTSGSGLATVPQRGRRGRLLSPPSRPYWLQQRSDGCLDLSFELPPCVYPSMLLREVTKSDVNSPEIVDLDRPVVDTRAKSWHGLTADQQATYKRFLAQKRQKLFTNPPRAVSVALLHQHIFRSGGMRRSLLPSMRGYDNVSK